jgi:Domain of unknown function (DUF4347)
VKHIEATNHSNTYPLKIQQALSAFAMTSSPISKLIFVDANVDDYQSLVQDGSNNAHIIILNPDIDGITQISQSLVNFRSLESIQIVSHGQEGVLQLGAIALSAGNLSYYAATATVVEVLCGGSRFVAVWL